MTTDTSEKGLERLICTALTGAPCDPTPEGMASERPASYGSRWICGDSRDYDREYCLDLAQFSAFLHATQPKAAGSLDLGQDSPARHKFLARLQGEVAKRGTIDVLRKGVKHGPHQIDLMYGTPSPGNEKARVQHGQNRFSVTRQLRYSQGQTQLALDLCLFINGLPVATFELKNRLTKQTVDDAVEQYKRDRDPSEKLFEPGRCLAHFAVDDQEVQFCTHLKGKTSWFLPFDKGWNHGGRQSAEPRRPQDRLPVEAGPHPREAHRHHRELRSNRGDEGRQVWTQEAATDMAPLPPAGRGAQALGRRIHQGSRP